MRTPVASNCSRRCPRWADGAGGLGGFPGQALLCQQPPLVTPKKRAPSQRDNKQRDLHRSDCGNPSWHTRPVPPDTAVPHLMVQWSSRALAEQCQLRRGLQAGGRV